jgi:DNA-binding transcriptional ArsR family regulator
MIYISYLSAAEKATLEKASNVIRAALHPLRQKMLVLLKENGERPLRVTAIYKKLRIEQSVASAHLSILRDAGLVISKRHGREIFYIVNEAAISHVLKTSEEITAPLAQLP